MAFQVVPPRRQPVFHELGLWFSTVTLKGSWCVMLETWLEGSLSSRLLGWEVEGWRRRNPVFSIWDKGNIYLKPVLEPPSSKHKHLGVPCLGVGNEKP